MTDEEKLKAIVERALATAESYRILLARSVAKHDAISARLAEVEAERDDYKRLFRDLDDEVNKRDAERGEVVKACPKCDGAALENSRGPWAKYYCMTCLHDFDEPAYWQRVRGPTTMNANRYRQSYDKPYVQEIQRKRAERLAKCAARKAARQAHIAKQCEERKKYTAPVVEPRQPWNVIHQFIPSIPPPPRGFLAYQMAWHKRTEAA